MYLYDNTIKILIQQDLSNAWIKNQPPIVDTYVRDPIKAFTETNLQE